MSRPSSQATLPLRALLDASGLSRDALRRAVLASGKVFDKAEAEGLSLHQADTWSVRLGFHPGELWPQWFDLEGAA